YLFNTGSCKWEVRGAAPVRRLIVQWTNVQYYDGTGPQAVPNTFQAILYETSNNIEIRTGLISDTEPITDANKVLGLENSDGTLAVAVPWPGNAAANGASWLFTYSSGCPSTGCACTGDMNHNGVVDGPDIALYVTDEINGGTDAC